MLGVAAVLAVFTVVLVLMVFAPSIVPVKVGSVADSAKVRDERAVEGVASRFATSLYSFNYRTIDADLRRIRADSTGNFSSTLTKVLGDLEALEKAILETRGESVGLVQGVDIREIVGDTATARVFAVQSMRTKREPKPRQQVVTVDLTLKRTSDGWKVDDIQQVAGQ